jgi:transcription initiation factor TFIIB
MVVKSKGVLEEERICPECGAEVFVRDDGIGEVVCNRCGFVITSTIVSRKPEWRAFNLMQRKKKSRMGSPLTQTLHDKGLSTKIDWRNKDYAGRRLKPDQRAKIYRIRKWQRRSYVSGSAQRNLAYALSELTKMAYKLNLPRNVLETAAFIYRRVVRGDFVRGRSIQGIAAATIYIACRKCKVIRQLEEIAKASRITKKNCARTYRFLLRKMDLEVPAVDPQDYISKIINHLDLSGQTESIASEILRQASELRLTNGRGPSSIAAACIYIASLINGERKTQGSIARAAHVTEVTIRNRYREITDELELALSL